MFLSSWIVGSCLYGLSSMIRRRLRFQAVPVEQDWQLPLGRRFRALKLWFVLRTYGAEGLRAYIRHHLALTDAFVGLVEADERFELVAPPRFGLTCFAVKVRGL